MELSDDAKRLLKMRYCRGEETPEDVYGRVARALGAPDGMEEEFFKIMNENRFLPNSPCLRNAGYSNVMSACFILDIEDSMDGIFSTLKASSLIYKAGGGVGINFSPLREEGSTLSSGGSSSGVMSFLRIFDAMTDAVKSGGFRRGAGIAVMYPDHPEIYNFIKAKVIPDSFKNFNFSIMLNDDFMKKIKDDDIIYLRARQDKRKVIGKLKCRDLFGSIAFAAWMSGDPGCLFFDRINKDNIYFPRQIIECVNPSLRGSTRVLTDRGIEEIQNLEGNIFKVPVFNPYYKNPEYADAICLKTGRNKKLFEITISGNHKYFATAEHEWPIYSNGYYKKKATSELQIGDRIPIMPQENLFYGKKWSYYDGFIVGWNLGDGWRTFIKEDGISQYGFVFGNSESDTIIMKLMQKLLSNITGNVYKACEYSHEINIRSRILNTYFEEFGGVDKKLGLPTVIWNEASEEFRKGLIDGIFSSDGYISINPNRIGLTSTKSKLLSDISELLGFYGIKTSITWRKLTKIRFPNGKVYDREYVIGTLRINHADAIRFRNTFNLTHKEKQQKLNSLPLSRNNIDSLTVKIISVRETDIVEDVWDLKVNDSSHSFKLAYSITSNCGEVPGLAWENCCLGSVNLNEHIEDNDINWDKFKETIQIGARFLLAIKKLNEFPIDKLYIMNAKTQRIGLGLMGYADALLKMHIKYDSNDALKLIGKIGSVMKEEAKIAAPQSAAVLSIAPTGSLSILASCSPSIEPIYSADYERRVVAGTFREERTETEYLRTAHEISPEWHLKIQAEFQKYIDNGVSKTVNLPYDASVQNVYDTYIMAYEMGCKGITVYRDRSKDTQVYYDTSKQKCNGDVCYL